MNAHENRSWKGRINSSFSRATTAHRCAQIAAEASIALGGIYNHFSGKEEIFTAVLEAYHPIHEIVPVIQASEGATIEEYVRNAAMGLMTALERQPGFLNLIFIEIVEFNSQHLPDLVV